VPTELSTTPPTMRHTEPRTKMSQPFIAVMTQQTTPVPCRYCGARPGGRCEYCGAPR
jgi:hypothetical protein